jgi:hypothetical protein
LLHFPLENSYCGKETLNIKFYFIGGDAMRARSLELVDKSIAAMIAAIEIYNKPDFKYREETFGVLCVNAWELLIKAYWLKINANKMRSLFVFDAITKKDGTKGIRKKIKTTRSGNPFTHSIDYLGGKLVSTGKLDKTAWDNIQAVIEIRDNSVHFYNKSILFSRRLQEVGSASVKNYVTAVKDWFDVGLTEFNFFLMPLSFVSPPKNVEGILLSKEESNLVQYIDSIDSAENPEKRYSVTVNVNVSFSKSKVRDALKVQLSNDPAATKITLTDDQIRERYKLSYDELSKKCRDRYSDFKIDKKYHEIRKNLEGDQKFAMVRFLDPTKPKGIKKTFYSEAILNKLDEHYTKIA